MTALDMLVIVFFVMSGVSILGICLLYLLKNEKIKKTVFYFLAIEGMVIAWMTATSTPTSSQFIFEVVMGWGLGALSVIALLVQVCGKSEKKFTIARLLVTVSVVLGIMNLFVI